LPVLSQHPRRGAGGFFRLARFPLAGDERGAADKSADGTPRPHLRKPRLSGDDQDFALAVRAIGRSSLDLEHTVSARDTVLWTAKHRIVATSIETNASLAWPDDIRAALTQHLETPHAHHLAT
jgi:hypothetical protein